MLVNRRVLQIVLGMSAAVAIVSVVAFYFKSPDFESKAVPAADVTTDLLSVVQSTTLNNSDATDSKSEAWNATAKANSPSQGTGNAWELRVNSLMQLRTEEEFFPELEVFYRDLMSLIQSEQLDFEYFSALGAEALSFPDNLASLNIGVLIATAIGDVTLLEKLYSSYTAQSSNVLQVFTLRRVAEFNTELTNATPELIRFYESIDDERFRSALRAAITSSNTVEALDWAISNAINSAGTFEKEAWLITVSRIGDKESVSEIKHLLEQSQEADVKNAMYRSLGRIGTEEAQAYLFTSANVSNTNAVVEALSWAPDLNAWDRILAKILDDSIPEYQQILALKAYATGYKSRSIVKTRATLQKIADDGSASEALRLTANELVTSLNKDI